MPKSRRRKAPAQRSRSPYGMFLDALEDLGTLPRALDAELMISSMLGVVYARTPSHRAGTVEEFAAGVLQYAQRRRTPAGDAVRATLHMMFPGLESAPLDPEPGAPRWLAAIGAVRPVATYAYGDEYGDQTSFVASYTYDDPDLGGPEHAIVALADHNLGFIKDIFVAESAVELRSRIEELVTGDEGIWLRDVDAGELRGTVSEQLFFTDLLMELPESDSLADTRAFALGRLALLPEGPGRAEHEPLAEDERAALVAEFAGAPEAAGLDDDRARYCAGLVIEHHDGYRGQDPLRWSPVAAEFFLLDWVPRKTLLDPPDRDALPGVLRAWVAWAGARRGLRPAAIVETQEAIDEMTPEFMESTDREQGPAAKVIAQLLADGVDLTDREAVAAGLSRLNAAHLARLAAGLAPE